MNEISTKEFLKSSNFFHFFFQNFGEGQTWPFNWILRTAPVQNQITVETYTERVWAVLFIQRFELYENFQIFELFDLQLESYTFCGLGPESIDALT